MERPPRQPSAEPWARAFTLVAIVAILAASTLWVFHSLSRVPGAALDATRSLLSGAGEVAAAFRQGTIETRFAAYATDLAGTSYLQFATLRQVEVYRREDRASIFWGAVELPDVIVSATAPVETTYYLDLDARWSFRLDGRTVHVAAPEIEFNRPAIDASDIEYRVEAASLLRDETRAMEALKRGMTAASIRRARDSVPLVRELGRRKTREFVEAWLLAAFSDGAGHRVEVRFADEPEGRGGLRGDRPRREE